MAWDKIGRKTCICILPVLMGLWGAQLSAAGPGSSGGAGVRGVGEKVEKGIVVLVEFPDVRHRVDRSFAQVRFSRQLNSYVQDMSYGKASLQVDITQKWYRMPNPVGVYRISPRNLEVDRSRVRRLIDDALAAADGEVDFSKYSFTVLFLSTTMPEYGMMGLCGYPGMLGWNSQDALTSRGGEPVKGVAIFCYQAHLGTLFHDVAHILGGVQEGRRMVPCLYDHDLQAKPGPLRETAVNAMINLGFWDPMSCHYTQWGVAPPGISSWTRMRLGWINPAKIKVVRPDQKADVVLGPLEESSSDTLVIKIPLSATTYYLIENRQPIGFDKSLPGSGVLILYADDRIAECRQRRAPVKLMNADPAVPHLDGAAFDVGAKGTFRDEQNKIAIQVKEKTGDSYRISITPM